MTRNTSEILVFIMGTVISVILGVILSNQFSSPSQYVIALLSEIIVIIFSVTWHFRGRLDDLSLKIADYSLLIKANDKVTTVDDPAFRQKFVEIRQSLVDISVGYYSIQSLAGVYDDDIASIDDLKKGEILRSMCPVGADSIKLRDQLSNKSFLASMDAHHRAVDRGVQVHRIYIFESRDSFGNSDDCRRHLMEAVKRGVNPRIILLDEKAFEDAVRLPHDFIIFGNKKVSVGRVGPNSRVDGADVYADPETIERFNVEYEKLRRLSEDAEKFLANSHESRESDDGKKKL